MAKRLESIFQNNPSKEKANYSVVKWDENWNSVLISEQKNKNISGYRETLLQTWPKAKQIIKHASLNIKDVLNYVYVSMWGMST